MTDPARISNGGAGAAVGARVVNRDGGAPSNGSRFQRWSEHGLLPACLLGVLTLAVSLLLANHTIKQFVETSHGIQRAHERLEKIEAVRADVNAAFSEVRAYVVEPSAAHLQLREQAMRRLDDSLSALRVLTAESVAQQDRLEVAVGLVMERRQALSDVMTAREMVGFDAARLLLDREPEAITAELRRVLDAMGADERTALAGWVSDDHRLGRFVSNGVIVIPGLVLAVLGGLLVICRGQLYRRRQAETERDHFFELSLDMLCVARVDGYFERINPAFAGSLGYSVEELLARPFLEFVHREDRAAVQAQAEKLARGEITLRFESRHRCKDGSWRRLSWNSQPDLATGRIYATARDVTEQHAAENDLRRNLSVLTSLFEALPGLYLVLAPDCRILGASNAYLEATMTTREVLVDRDLFEAFPDNPDDPAATGTANLRTSIERVLETRTADTMAIQRYDVRRPDGSFEQRFWSPVNAPVLGPDDQVEYIIHRVEDVTEYVQRKSGMANDTAGNLRGRLENMEAELLRNSEKLKAVNEMLRAANAELESFSYSVSHDLRTPLRAIDGFAALLEEACEGRLDETSGRYLQVIRDSVRGMSSLIDDLLALSRLGRTAITKTTVDSAELVREAQSAVLAAHGTSRAAFDVGPLPDVTGDRQLLLQVWINLLANAVKYSDKAEAPKIRIRAQAEGTNVVFSVQDNGAGFDMRHYGKLFRVFSRLHSGTEYPGTGVGLAIVQRIVARHGGKVWAKGEPGAGAVFFFSLPGEMGNA